MIKGGIGGQKMGSPLNGQKNEVVGGRNNKTVPEGEVGGAYHTT